MHSGISGQVFGKTGRDVFKNRITLKHNCKFIVYGKAFFNTPGFQVIEYRAMLINSSHIMLFGAVKLLARGFFEAVNIILLSDVIFQKYGAAQLVGIKEHPVSGHFT